jgi:hypothetical protein
MPMWLFASGIALRLLDLNAELPWDGMDGWESALPDALLLNTTVNSSFHEACSATRSDSTERAFTVLGQYNTGTNLLMELVRRNFPAQVARSYIPSNLQVDRAPPADVLWKHSKPATISSSWQQELRQCGAVALVMLRDPLSWLQSIKKAPYDYGACVRRPGWLTSSCTLPAWRHSRNGGRTAATPVTLASLEAHWNEWTREYNRLRAFGFADAVLIRYEDLVRDTDAEVSRIARAIGAPETEVVKQVHASAKSHGDSAGRAEAIKKLETKSYLKLFTNTELEAACARFDLNLMHMHQYDDCDRVKFGRL